MRSGQAGALVWTVMERSGRLKWAHEGSRKLKNLKVLVEIRCAGPRAHELAYVYKMPFDFIDKIHHVHHLGFLDGVLLFVSPVDATHTRDGKPVVEAKDSDSKPYYGRDPDGRLIRWARGVRLRDVLVDLIDFHPEIDDEHSDLVTRCRCGARPPADRHELLALAREALADGKTRRVFL